MKGTELMVLGVRRRFYDAMASYCKGALEHVDRESQAKVPSIKEQLATRRRSSGVTPLFALVEYGWSRPVAILSLLIRLIA